MTKTNQLKLFVYLSLLSALLYEVSGACSNNLDILPALHQRSVNTTATSPSPVVNDALIELKWYSVKRAGGGNYRMSSVDLDGLPKLGHCGTLNPIYLQHAVPKLEEGKEISLQACYMSITDNCEVSLHVKVRMCFGDVQYYLQTPDSAVSGYCFESPARMPAPNYVIRPKPEIKPTLIYIDKIINSHNVAKPVLEFTCHVQPDSRFYYYVQWNIGSVIVKAGKLTKNLQSTKLYESELVAKKVGLGTTVTCGVSVAYDDASLMTNMLFSDGFFIGIKVLTPSVNVPRGGHGVIRFRQTVPFGCAYVKSLGLDLECNFDFAMFDFTAINCSTATIAGQGSHCGANIKGQKYGDCMNKRCPIQHFTDNEMKVSAIGSVSYAMKNTFEVMLKTPSLGNVNTIWQDYSLADVHVKVTDHSTWEKKSCHASADPQIQTFDGVNYWPNYNGNEGTGEYILYQHTTHPIQVQYKTYQCTTVHGTCTCGVIIRAGGDLWMYGTCNNVNYIGFLSCKDGILDVRKVSSDYEIHTPTGTYMKVSMNMVEKYLNIDVFPSPSDVGKTQGHCGTLNDNITDELTRRDGVVEQHDVTNWMRFYNSWKITSSESYFNTRNHNPSIWQKEQYMCVCPYKSGRHSEAICSAQQTSSCLIQRTSPVCNSKRKRSIRGHSKEIQRRFKLFNANVPLFEERIMRSADVQLNVTYDVAKAKCMEVFQSIPVYALENTVPDSRINGSLTACINDAMIDVSKTNWQQSHFDTWTSKVHNELKRNITYQETHPAEKARFLETHCQDECQGQGICVNGTCECKPGYAGATCFIEIAAVLEISDIEGGGVCDLADGDNCLQCLQFQSEYLMDTFHCKIGIEEVDVQGVVNKTESIHRQGQYENIFEGYCCPADDGVRSRRSLSSGSNTFTTKYKIAVSNDGVHYGSPRSVYVYDSTCQEYVVLPNGDWLFSLKDGTCFIDGRCHKSGQPDGHNSCNRCVPEADKYAWTYDCSGSQHNNLSDNDKDHHGHDNDKDHHGNVKDENDDNTIAYVGFSIAGIVVIGLIALFAIWMVKRSNKSIGAPQQFDNLPPPYKNGPGNVKFQKGRVSVIDAESHYETLER